MVSDVKSAADSIKYPINTKSLTLEPGFPHNAWPQLHGSAEENGVPPYAYRSPKKDPAFKTWNPPPTSKVVRKKA